MAVKCARLLMIGFSVAFEAIMIVAVAQWSELQHFPKRKVFAGNIRTLLALCDFNDFGAMC